MAADTHVLDLFSAAYDRALGEAEGEAFRLHLAACAACADAFDRYRAALDGLRALPAEPMPVPVHLPAGPPEAEPEAWWRRAGALLAGRPLVLGGAVAAVATGAVAAALALHGGHPAQRAPTAAGARAPVLAERAPACPASATGAGRSVDASAGPAIAGTVAGLANRVAVTDPGHPGQTLVLATAAVHYPRGARIDVIGALVTQPAAGPGQPSAAATIGLPCITLSTPNRAAPPLAAVAGGSAASEAAPAPPPAGALQMSPAVSPATLPVLRSLTVPATVPPGTVLHVDAESSGDPPGTRPIHAQLDIVAD